MRWALFSTLLAASLAPAQAQSPRIERVEIVQTGIMKAEDELKGVKSKSISTGQRIEGTTKIIERTTTIPARSGTIFGADVKFIGKPKGGEVTVKVVWRYPEPGLRNPDTGTVKFTDEYEVRRRIGDDDTFFWSLQREWVLVPGRWTLELWQGGRRLASQDFMLVK